MANVVHVGNSLRIETVHGRKITVPIENVAFIEKSSDDEKVIFIYLKHPTEDNEFEVKADFAMVSGFLS